MQVAQNASTVVIKRYKNCVFFLQFSVVFTAWCNKRTRTKKLNLGIFEIHSKIGQLENIFCREKKQKNQNIIFKKPKK